MGKMEKQAIPETPAQSDHQEILYVQRLLHAHLQAVSIENKNPPMQGPQGIQGPPGEIGPPGPPVSTTPASIMHDHLIVIASITANFVLLPLTIGAKRRHRRARWQGSSWCDRHKRIPWTERFCGTACKSMQDCRRIELVIV